MSVELSDLQRWIGKEECRHDQVTAAPLACLSATLNRDDPFPSVGDPVPPLWSWLYFLSADKECDLGPDGHVKRGGFLPPAPLPRRMWAGGRLRFLRDLRVGDAITRTSRILDVQIKNGRNGQLVFVIVGHEISGAAGLLLTEEHDIVYRDNPKPDDHPAQRERAAGEAMWTRTVQPDDVLLFRYSALTFNGHRIHYDRRYATQIENYPGLVLHGPLLATLLLDLLRCNLRDVMVTHFSFRAITPLFDTASFLLCGRLDKGGEEAHLWTETEDGFVTMRATAVVAMLGRDRYLIHPP
jgi:3-methylfumaryl-CoA hydratase